jgi:DNA polymerase-4
VLESAVGRAHGRQLAQLARGVDDRPVEPDRAVKSVSHEETYAVDLYDRAELRQEIVKMADSVASRLRRAGLAGRTVTLKVRAADFTTRTRSRSGPERLSDAPAIAARAVALLDAEDLSPGVRLLGVGVSNLTEIGAEPAQQMRLDLDEPPGGGHTSDDRSWRDASRAVDAIRGRYGDDSVGPATLLGPGRLGVKRPGDTRWGPAEDRPPVAGGREE